MMLTAVVRRGEGKWQHEQVSTLVLADLQLLHSHSCGVGTDDTLASPPTLSNEDSQFYTQHSTSQETPRARDGTPRKDVSA